jgi:transcriptional regulator with XRE-family HTH domain
MTKRITNPLTKRRIDFGATQSQVAKFLGVNQSQYSRIENGENIADKYVNKLAEFFNCEVNELWQGQYLEQIEEEFLEDKSLQCGYTFHESKPDQLYLDIRGWFPYEAAIEAERLLTEALAKYRRNGLR